MHIRPHRPVPHEPGETAGEHGAEPVEIVGTHLIDDNDHDQSRWRHSRRAAGLYQRRSADGEEMNEVAGHCAGYKWPKGNYGNADRPGRAATA